MLHTWLLCGYRGSEPRSSRLCGGHHIPIPQCLPLQVLTWLHVIVPVQDPAILPLQTLRDRCGYMRCHPSSRTLAPSVPCPRGCLSTVFQDGILNRGVQQQAGRPLAPAERHWSPLGRSGKQKGYNHSTQQVCTGV